ncbi:MAG: hypothetical protein R8G33_10660 [Gammaproteobacteria bacterium]|nr:hypothetical protein [Gammaproteobacteria bacterium]
MPYFVFHLNKGTNGVVRDAELKNSFPEYKDAKLFARNLRAELEVKDVSEIKIMFADNEDIAEAKLTQNREAPILREWEK